MSDKIEGREADIARLSNIKYRMEKNEAISVEDANFYSQNKELLNPGGNYPKIDLQDYQNTMKSIEENTPITKGEFIAAMNNVGQVMNNALNSFRDEMVKMINNSAVNLQTYAAQTGAQAPAQDTKSELVKGIMETAMEYLKTTRQPQSSTFEQELLERSKNEMMESVNIVSLINKKVKGALVSDIAGTVADNIMKQTTANLQTHDHGF